MTRLIDADALKEAIAEHTDYKGYLICDPDVIIDLMPTVEERPQGEWIFDDRSGQFICSKCEGGVNMPTLMGEPLYKWCPWCGADMREGDEK